MQVLHCRNRKLPFEDAEGWIALKLSTGQILALISLTVSSRLCLCLLLFDNGAVVSARAAGMQTDLCAVRQNRHDFLHGTFQHNLLRWR